MDTKKNLKKCEKCQFEYFEIVTATRIDSTIFATSTSKPVAPDDEQGFIFLRCLRCGKLNENNVFHSGMGIARTQYQKSVEILEEIEKFGVDLKAEETNQNDLESDIKTEEI